MQKEKGQPIDSVMNFLKVVLACWRDWKRLYQEERPRDAAMEWLPWFRGEPFEVKSPLRPKLYRQASEAVKDLLHAEQELRFEFTRRAAQLIAPQPKGDHWEQYFLMAHHGVPTRLLDWTDGALVALYFAVRFSPEKSETAAVYMLDPWWLNDFVFKAEEKREARRAAKARKAKKLTAKKKAGRSEGVALPDWDEAEPYLHKDPLFSDSLRARLVLAIDPYHVSGRVAAQRSRFTIFGRDPQALASLLGRPKCRLKKIVVKRSTLIERELEMSGITESTIYPDMDGLGRELDLTWKRKYLRGGAQLDRVSRAARLVLGRRSLNGYSSQTEQKQSATAPAAYPFLLNPSRPTALQEEKNDQARRCLPDLRSHSRDLFAIG